MPPVEIDYSISLPFLFMLASGVFTWWATRRKDVDEKFRGGSKRMDGLDVRVSRLEQSIEAMPAKDDLHALQLTISDMSGELKAMGARQQSTNELLRRLDLVVSRHEDHLLDKAK